MHSGCQVCIVFAHMAPPLTRPPPVALLCREVEAGKSAGQGSGEQAAKEASKERSGQATPADADSPAAAAAAAKPDGEGAAAAAEDGKQAEQSKVRHRCILVLLDLRYDMGGSQMPATERQTAHAILAHLHSSPLPCPAAGPLPRAPARAVPRAQGQGGVGVPQPAADRLLLPQVGAVLHGRLPHQQGPAGAGERWCWGCCMLCVLCMCCALESVTVSGGSCFGSLGTAPPSHATPCTRTFNKSPC